MRWCDWSTAGSLNHAPGAWCVEERAIEDLKANGCGSTKKVRRMIGRRIRGLQRQLRRGVKSISVEITPVRTVLLPKHSRHIRVTYELPPKRVEVSSGYARAEGRA